jgi:myosin heavy subunit
MHGFSENDLKELGLKLSDLKSYNYINQGNSMILRDQNDDKQNYRLVNEAMKIVNFEPEFIKTIWNIIAAIIHLGQLNFEKDKVNNNEKAKISSDSQKSIKFVSKLLKVDETDLQNTLTSRLIATGHKDLVTTFHSVKEAEYAKDAFAKVDLFFFSNIFRILVFVSF